MRPLRLSFVRSLVLVILLANGLYRYTGIPALSLALPPFSAIAVIPVHSPPPPRFWIFCRIAFHQEIADEVEGYFDNDIFGDWDDWKHPEWLALPPAIGALSYLIGDSAPHSN